MASSEDREAREAANTAEILAAINAVAAEQRECFRLLTSVEAMLDEVRSEIGTAGRFETVTRLRSIQGGMSEMRELLIQALDDPDEDR